MSQPGPAHPSRQEATQILSWAAEFNPGPWQHHSHLVGFACRTIAAKLPGIDPELAEVAGLLHDIGRRFPGTNVRHCTDGYRILLDRGFPFLADVCISHCFLHKSLDSFTGVYDVDTSDRKLIDGFLLSHVDNDYDRLVQLCDAFTDGRGYCLIEKRLVDVALRYGVAAPLAEKWKLIMNLKTEIDTLIGFSVYRLLPGIAQNTFGDGFVSPAGIGVKAGES